MASCCTWGHWTHWSPETSLLTSDSQQLTRINNLLHTKWFSSIHIDSSTGVFLGQKHFDLICCDSSCVRKGRLQGVLGWSVTLSTCACEACCSVSSTMSRYFLNSPPIARAISPKTDRIWGFTDLCTFSFCKHMLQHYSIRLNILLKKRQMKLYRALETK